MKKILVALSTASLTMVSAVSLADTQQPVALWLCSDYLTVEDSVQDAALGFAVAVNKQGKPQEAVLDMDGVIKRQPEILQYCKENPKIALRDALVQTDGSAKK